MARAFSAKTGALRFDGRLTVLRMPASTARTVSAAVGFSCPASLCPYLIAEHLREIVADRKPDLANDAK